MHIWEAHTQKKLYLVAGPKFGSRELNTLIFNLWPEELRTTLVGKV